MSTPSPIRFGRSAERRPDAKVGLFTSDDVLQRLQRHAERQADETAGADREGWRVAVENARELREHARWRSLGVYLFVIPALVTLIMLGGQILAYLVERWMMAPQ
ncbi:MAG: hypothetical protein IRY91_04315 [Gemmatimonadaceae bacterium]|nr:hypothetical protein [Gemmatimonadaceae bacterium]